MELIIRENENSIIYLYILFIFLKPDIFITYILRALQKIILKNVLVLRAKRLKF